jgi:hypothetical protein
MLLILYPAGVNWFYETLAHHVRDELALQGHDSRLITPAEFVGPPIENAGDADHILIINLFECAHSIGGPIGGNARSTDALKILRDRLPRFNRRILLMLDGIYTSWFSAQMTVAAGTLTDVFDLCMVPQTGRPTLGGCRYTWIQESLTRYEREHRVEHEVDRPLVWSMVGHATRDRADVANVLAHSLSPSGFVFMPGLRPFYQEGSQNLSAEALDRVLRKTRYYVWTSHHRVPYHEGLRSLHAIRNGAIPVKIDPLFAHVFRDIPWVYPSVTAFTQTIDKIGEQAMFQRSLQFALDRGTLGEHLARALYGGPKAMSQEPENVEAHTGPAAALAGASR